MICSKLLLAFALGVYNVQAFAATAVNYAFWAERSSELTTILFDPDKLFNFLHGPAFDLKILGGGPKALKLGMLSRGERFADYALNHINAKTYAEPVLNAIRGYSQELKAPRSSAERLKVYQNAFYSRIYDIGIDFPEFRRDFDVIRWHLLQPVSAYDARIPSFGSAEQLQHLNVDLAQLLKRLGQGEYQQFKKTYQLNYEYLTPAKVEKALAETKGTTMSVNKLPTSQPADANKLESGTPVSVSA